MALSIAWSKNLSLVGTVINPGKSHGQGPWVSWRKHRLDNKLVSKQEDMFLLDILMMVVRLQGMPRLERSRLGLQAILDDLYALPLLAFIYQARSRGVNVCLQIVFPNPNLLRTAGSRTFLVSRGLLRRCKLAGQGRS